jgi:hypothetical protein
MVLRRAGGRGIQHDNNSVFIGRNFVVAGSIYNGLAGWADEQPPLCSTELRRRATARYSMGWSVEVGLRRLNAARTLFNVGSTRRRRRKASLRQGHIERIDSN